MKNIHLIESNELNQGYVLGKCIKELSDVRIGQFVKTYYLMFDKEYFQHYNIYITNNEETKLNNWVIQVNYEKTNTNLIKCVTEAQVKIANDKNGNFTKSKIILTTDKKLIADGVQEISEDFLNWFCNDNSSCEYIEVKKICNNCGDTDCIHAICSSQIAQKKGITYKIIIPEDKPKIVTENIQSTKGEDLGKISYIPLVDSDVFDTEGERLKDAWARSQQYNILAETPFHKPDFSHLKQEVLEETIDRIFKEYSNMTSLVEGHYNYLMDSENFEEASLELVKLQQEQNEKEIQDLKNRLDIIRESSTKISEIVENLEQQTKKMYSIEDLANAYDLGVKSMEKRGVYSRAISDWDENKLNFTK